MRWARLSGILILVVITSCKQDDVGTEAQESKFYADKDLSFFLNTELENGEKRAKILEDYKKGLLRELDALGKKGFIKNRGEFESKQYLLSIVEADQEHLKDYLWCIREISAQILLNIHTPHTFTELVTAGPIPDFLCKNDYETYVWSGGQASFCPRNSQIWTYRYWIPNRNRYLKDNACRNFKTCSDYKELFKGIQNVPIAIEEIREVEASQKELEQRVTKLLEDGVSRKKILDIIRSEQRSWKSPPKSDE